MSAVSTTPGLDVRLHNAAIRAALYAGIDTINGTVGDYSQIPGGNRQPGAVPERAALIAVERRVVPARRLTGQAGRSSWRASIGWVGDSVDNAHKVELVITEALEETSLLIGGHRSTPLQHESSTRPAFDDGAYFGFTVFTYTL